MKPQRRVTHTLRTAVVGVLVVVLALITLADAAGRTSPAVAGSPSPDSIAMDRLSRAYFDERSSGASALLPTTAQQAAILAAELLLSPIYYYTDLPLVTK